MSRLAINLVKKFEGCNLTTYINYRDNLAIGYGTTNKDMPATRTRITSNMTISKETAEKWFIDSIYKIYVPLVNKYDSIYDWTQNEFDALVSYVYGKGYMEDITLNGHISKAGVANRILNTRESNPDIIRRRELEYNIFVK